MFWVVLLTDSGFFSWSEFSRSEWVIIVGTVAAIVAAVTGILGIGVWAKLTEGRADVRFVIYDKKKKAKYGYVEQDHEEHFTKSLHLPSNSDVLLTLWMKPQFSFNISIYYVYTNGRMDEKPIPLQIYNPFVIKGKYRELIPDRDDEVYRGHYGDFYHIWRRRLTRGEVYLLGFILRTQKRGKYSMTLALVTDNQLFKHKLKLVVEDSCYQSLYCIQHRKYCIKYHFNPRYSGERTLQ